MSQYNPTEEATLHKSTPDVRDGVNSYGRLLCLLAMEFKDAWKEGDEERITRCWHIFLLHFHTAGCTNYALHTLRLQLQLASLPPKIAH